MKYRQTKEPNRSPSASGTVEDDDILYPFAIPFVLTHLACFGVYWTGITYEAIVIFLVLFWVRMFAIGAGYHRYFSHRAYKTSRAFQFVLAVLSQSTAQKSVLWWAGKHRHHHLHSDTKEDIHSPRHKGFFYSHVGWIFARKHDTADLTRIADFARFPELMWLHKYELVPAVVLALLCFLVGGWSGLVVGFFWSTVIVYHTTFCINSLAHVYGRKRYVTGDDSRNNWLLAIFTMGEGWHNNHHAYQSSARQGFKWWEIDATYYILKALSWIGVVWDIKTPSKAVRRNEHRLGSRVTERAAAQLAASFKPDQIINAIMTTSSEPGFSELRQMLGGAQHRTAEVLESMNLPDLPTRHEILARARSMFPETSSMEDIVNRGHAAILETIATRLSAMPAPSQSINR